MSKKSISVFTLFILYRNYAFFSTKDGLLGLFYSLMMPRSILTVEPAMAKDDTLVGITGAIYLQIFYPVF